MRAVKLPVQVTEDRLLQLRLPDDLREAPMEVIVLVPDGTEEWSSPAVGGDLVDFLNTSRIDPQSIRSKQQIDRYLQTERESWE